MKLKCAFCGHVATKAEVYENLADLISDDQIRAQSSYRNLWVMCKKCGVVGIHTVVED
jgi:hypothetical protein